MSLNLRKPEPEEEPKQKHNAGWLPPVLWVVALVCVGFMGIVISQRTRVIRGTDTVKSGSVDNAYVDNIVSNPGLPDMNELEINDGSDSLERQTSAVTYKPENQRTEAVKYTIETGDSLYGIANKFDLQPETIQIGRAHV